MKLGFQISSVRPYLTTPAQVEQTVSRLAEMGWRTMQMQWVSPEVPDEAVAESLRRHGITVLGVQDKTDAVRSGLERMIAQNRLWGGKSLTVSGIPSDCFTMEGLARFAEELRGIEQQLELQGMTLAFHPVFGDYTPVEGVPAVERLLELLPEMGLVLCVYHTVKAGLDPLSFLRRYAGRIEIVHLKNSVVLADGREALMPVGQGNIEWEPVLETCRETGVSWVLAEQERWEKDAFACMEESFAYLTGLGLRP